MATCESVKRYLLEEIPDEWWVEIIRDASIQDKINKGRKIIGKRTIKFANTFIPPTLEEVLILANQYKEARKMNYNALATAERYFYTRKAADWTYNAGKQKVSDWKADFLRSLNWLTA